MSLKNLKSIFTEGFLGTSTINTEDKLGKSAFENMNEQEYAKFQSENLGDIKGPVDFFPNDNAQGFTNNLFNTLQTKYSGIDLNLNTYTPTSTYKIGGLLGSGFVDFFGGSNSYGLEIDPSVEGFSNFSLFNSGGYVFPSGDIGNSKYLGVMSGKSPADEDIISTMESLSMNQLGFGDFNSDLLFGNISNDIRFRVGFGWPFSNVILQTVQEGNSFSMYYTNTNGNISIGVSGAISNFGPLSDLADSLGFDLPVFDFSENIFSPPVPTYEDTVFELANGTPSDLGQDPTNAVTAMGNKRGAAFQTIYPNKNYGKANLEYFIEGVAEFSHGSRVISNWLELGKSQPGTNIPTLETGISSADKFGNKLFGHKVKTNGEVTDNVGNASKFYNSVEGYPHFYLGEDRVSFVKLGIRQFESFSEAMATGNLDIVKNFIQDKVEDWWDSPETEDKVDQMSANIESKMKDGLGNAWNDLGSTFGFSDTSVGKSVSMFLAGSSTDDIVNDSGVFGGKFGKVQDKIDSLQEDVLAGLGNINDSITKSTGYNFGLDNLAGSALSVPEVSFAPKEINSSPEIIELINKLSTYPSIDGMNTMLNDIGKAGLAADLNRAQLIYQGVTSKAPRYNPRTIQPNIPKNKNIVIQKPYSMLEKSPYSTSFRTKHLSTAALNLRKRADATQESNAEYEPPTSTQAGTQANPIQLEETVVTATNSPAKYYPYSMGIGAGGDQKNVLEVLSGPNLTTINNEKNPNYQSIAEGAEHGMPFYFKDLRDDKYIIFRAYLQDMSQEVQPEWSEHKYLGRSEPSYTYNSTKRAINFSFKVYAQSKPELQVIYTKLNYLQGLAYPRYHNDGSRFNRMRMMPPLMALRIGDLFGNMNRNLTGFIEGLTYTWDPQTVSWETEEGKRVPKECLVSVQYKVIHREPPSVDTANSEFLGLTTNTSTLS